MPFLISHGTPGETFTKQDYDVMIRACERLYPDLYRRVNPRNYPDMGNYYSTKILAASLVEMTYTITKFGIHHAPNSSRLIVPCIDYLIKRQMPIMFLTPDFVEAIKMTDFPTDLDWMQMQMPYEHGILALPRGTITHPTDKDCAFIVYSRYKKTGDYYPPLKEMGPPIGMVSNNFSVCGMCPEPGLWYDSCITEEMKKTVKIKNVFEGCDHVKSFPVKTKHDSDLATPDDEAMNAAINAITFGTILALTSRPDLLTPAAFIKAIKHKKTGNRVEFWSPNIIGKNYKHPQPVDNIDRIPGTHASPRMHWRRGHFRQHRYGYRNNLVKTLWIEPRLINAVPEIEKSRNSVPGANK